MIIVMDVEKAFDKVQLTFILVLSQLVIFNFQGTFIFFLVMPVPIFIPINSEHGLPFLHILGSTSLFFFYNSYSISYKMLYNVIRLFLMVRYAKDLFLCLFFLFLSGHKTSYLQLRSLVPGEAPEPVLRPTLLT